MHIADWRSHGFLPLQHHDTSFSVAGRLRPAAVRVGPDNPSEYDYSPCAGSYGDISGGMLWKVVGTERQSLHTWFLTGAGVVNSKGSPTPPKGLVSKTRGSAGGWLPIRTAPATPDTRFEAKNPQPAIPVQLPKGHTGIVTVGTEEYSQQETLHPDWLNYLIAVNEAGDPACGTEVYDLDATGALDPTLHAKLQTLLSVVTGPAVGGPGLALQLGKAGNQDGASADLPFMDYTTSEVAFGSHRKGGPLLTGKGCRHTIGKDHKGRTVKPLHLWCGSNFWSTPAFCGPFLFESVEYPKTMEFPILVDCHIKFDAKLGAWRVHSSSHFYEPPPKKPPPKPKPPKPPKKPPEDGPPVPWQEDGPPPFLQPPAPEPIGFLPGGPTGSPVPAGTEDSIFGPEFDPVDGTTFGDPTTSDGGASPGGESIFDDDFTTDGGTQFGSITGPGQPITNGDGQEPSYPGSPFCMEFPNIIFKATATALGQPNIAGSAGQGTLSSTDLSTAQGAPQTGHISGYATGDGTWGGMQTTMVPGYSATPIAAAGGAVFLPPSVTVGQALGEPGLAPVAGTPHASLAFPDGYSSTFYGPISRDPDVGPVKDGVRVEGDGAGAVDFTYVDPTGADGATITIDPKNGAITGATGLESGLGAAYDTGDESDGDVTIGANTEETNPQYGNLTIDAGFSLTAPSGTPLYVRATGDVQIDGTLGGPGLGPIGGAAGAGSAGASGGPSSTGGTGQPGASGTYASAAGGAGGGGSGGVDGDTDPFPDGGAGGPGADGRGGTVPHPTNGGSGAPGGAALAGEGHGAGPGSNGTDAAQATHLDDDYANEPVSGLPDGAPGAGGGAGSGGSTDGTATTASGGSAPAPTRPHGAAGNAGSSANMAGGGSGGTGGPGGKSVALDARGNVTIGATGSISADGGDGGAGGAGGTNDGGALAASGGGGGGGSGGGGAVARVRHGGSFTATGNFSADAGSPGGFGAGGDVGGWDGGDGSNAGASANGHAFSVQMS